MAEAGEERPFKMVAEAFHAMAETIKNKEDLQIATYAKAASYMRLMLRAFGTPLWFGENDYANKVQDLATAANSFVTLKEMIDKDIQREVEYNDGSNTRNLLGVNRSLTMLKEICEELNQSDFIGDFFRDAARKAYLKCFAPYLKHSNRVNFEAAIMNGIPTWSLIMTAMNEDTDSMKALMIKYKDSSEVVIEYINNLFISRDLGIDW